MKIGTGFLASNLARLKKFGNGDLADTLAGRIQDGFRVEMSRSGDPIVFAGDYALHSRYDPRKEAFGLSEKIVSESPAAKGYILIGVGMGYLVEELLKNSNGKMLIAVEPSPEVLARAMDSREFGRLIAEVDLISGDDPEELYRKIAAAADGENNLKGMKVIISSAARQYAQEITTALEGRLNRTIRLSGQRLRILVVGPLYGGSLPITGYAASALRSLGHRVEVLDNSVFDPARLHLESVTRDKIHLNQLMGVFTATMAESVTAKVLDMKAQMVLFMAQSPTTPEVLEELRKIGIPTAFWFVEDGSLMEYGLRMAPFYDVFFHIQKGPFEDKLRRAGARQVHYLPLAADPEVHKPLTLTKEEFERFTSDVSHIGAGYYNRRRFFIGLLDYDFKLWGNEWEQAGPLAKILQDEGARVNTENMVKIFNATRINLNLHSSTYTESVNPHGDFVNPRTFELAATGAFQLVDERKLLPELFEPGKEVATFNDLAGCRKAIDHYLANPDEAKAIAEASRERVLREHTYRHRMEEMLGVVLEHHEPAFPGQPLNTVEALIEQAGEDSELAAFFTRMGDPDEELTLEGVVENICKEEGELGEAEAIFLLMNEFRQHAKEKGLV